MAQPSLILLVPSFTEMLLAPYRTWEKNPILEPRAIGYRTGPKNGVFFPMAVKRQSPPRKMVTVKEGVVLSNNKAADEENRTTLLLYGFRLAELLSPTGISVAWRPGRAPGPGGPRGGVLYRRP